MNRPQPTTQMPPAPAQDQPLSPDEEEAPGLHPDIARISSVGFREDEEIYHDFFWTAQQGEDTLAAPQNFPAMSALLQLLTWREQQDVEDQEERLEVWLYRLDGPNP